MGWDAVNSGCHLHVSVRGAGLPRRGLGCLVKRTGASMGWVTGWSESVDYAGPAAMSLADAHRESRAQSF